VYSNRKTRANLESEEMNKLNEWQMREMLERLLQTREFSFIGNMTVADLLRELVLITLDNLFKQLDEPKAKKEDDIK